MFIINSYIFFLVKVVKMFVVSYFLVKAAVPAVVFVSVYMGPAA